MTKEELEKEAENIVYGTDYDTYDSDGHSDFAVIDILVKFAEPREKRIAELEEKISVLLSCKNCPENKDGYICKKEYENKCLTQKIQFIKELQEEITELKDKLNNLSSVAEVRLANWQKYEKENTELKTKVTALENANKAMVKELDDMTSGGLSVLENVVRNKEKLTKAKELLNEFMRISKASDEDFEHDYSELIAETEQFLKGE